MQRCDRSCSLFGILIWIWIYRPVCGNLELKIIPSEVHIHPDNDNPIFLRYHVDLQNPMQNSSETTIHWSKDGSPITHTWNRNSSGVLEPSNENFAYVLNDDSLFIGRLNPTKEGTYTCTVRVWDAGEISAEERAVVPVYFAMLEDFSFIPSDVIREEGTFATLTCVSGFSIPAANVSWEKAGNGQLNGVQSQHILRQEKGMYMTSSSIQFSNLSRKDHGEYYCVATNDILPTETKSSRRVFLRVKEKPSSPDIVLQPENAYVIEGQPSKFLCISSGSPRPTITWYRDNVKIDINHSDGGMELDSYGHTSVLKILSASYDFTGQYKCLAENELGKSMSDPAVLQIASFSWRFVQEPEDTDAYTGESVTMICRPPSSQPPAVVSWYKDNDLIKFDESSTLRQLSTGDLYFTAVDLFDSGNYFCNANNKLLQSTTASQRARLAVFAPPTITNLPEAIEVILEHTVRLDCNTTGYPFPTVQWTRNGIPFPSGGRVTLGHRNQTLFISNVVLDDEALYACTVKNRFGNDSAGPCLLNVLVPPVIYREVPEYSLTDLKVPFVIRCSASGSPLPGYNWTKDDALLDLSAASRYSVVDEGLQIDDVQEEDSGYYNCTAYNTGGATWSAGALRVKIPATITQITDVAVTEEYKNVNITCKGRGYPEVTFEWILEATENSGSIEHTITYTEDSTTLMLKNLARSAHGSRAICVVKNVWSTTNASVLLEINTKPEVATLVVSGKFPVIPGRNVTLNCTIYGRPTPVVSWMHHHGNNGRPVTIDGGNEHFQEISYGELYIPSVQENDEGVFTCLAVNSVGRASKEVSIVVLDFPEIVQDIHLTTESSTSMKLKWKSDDFEKNLIKSYSVRYHKENDFQNYTVFHYKAKKGPNTAVISNLNPSTSYAVQISAENDAGSSLWSFHRTAVTLADAPSAPVEIGVDAVASSSFEVTWNEPKHPNGEIVEYEIRYRKLSPGKYYPLIEIRLPKTNDQRQKYVVSELDPFSKYTVAVKAGTAAENDTILWGESSPYMSVDTNQAAPSTAPPNLKTKVISPHSIFVSWSEIPESERNGVVVEYRIKYEDVYLGILKEIIINVTEHSYLIDNLSPWREYALKLCGATSAGDGPWSPDVYLETLASAPTSAVSGLNIASVSSRWVNITWTSLSKMEHNGPGLHYTLSVSEVGNDNGRQNFRSSENFYAVEKLKPWTYYQAKVRAQNEATGHGPWSSDIIFKTKDSVSGLCSQLRAKVVGYNSALLQWRAPAEPNGVLEGYVVSYKALSCTNPAYSVSISTQRCVLQHTTITPEAIEILTSGQFEMDVKETSPAVTDSVREPTRTIDARQNFSEMTATSGQQTNGLTFPPSAASYPNAPWRNSALPLVLELTEGPRVEEYVAVVDGRENVIEYNISSLKQSTWYMLSVQASNPAGVGPPIMIYERTGNAPATTTTLLFTTTTDTTTMHEASDTTEMWLSETDSVPQQSVVIAGGTAGAVFICIVIAMVSVARCIRMKSSGRKTEELSIFNSPVIPKHFSDTSDGNFKVMASFTGPTEEAHPEIAFGATNKYSITHYRKCHSPGPDQSDSEFEYAVIQDGIKAFGDSLAKSGDDPDKTVYVESDAINKPSNHCVQLQSTPKKDTKPKCTQCDSSSQNWTLCSNVSTSSSHSVKQSRKMKRPKSKRSSSPTTYSDIDSIGAHKQTKPTQRVPYYEYGRCNMNNNTVHNLPGHGQNSSAHLTRYIEEDTYL